MVCLWLLRKTATSWISCYVPFKKTDIVNNIASLPSAVPGRYYVANEQECAGVCLTFLRDNLLYAKDELGTGAPPAEAYQLFDRLAEQAPAGSDRVVFAPWLYGERTPIEDHTVAFPVRALRGVFAWVSCPAALQRLQRDAALADKTTDWSVPDLSSRP